jgi:flagellar biosynthesis/type III secretory pathway M-ring protein FliF/YscJ
VLVITTTITAMGISTSPRQRRQRRDRRGRRSRHALSPTAEHALELARARAVVHEAQALAAAPRPVRPLVPTGQIIDISDGRRQGREMSVEHAQAIAEHVAETDPQRVAEVINQWIRADSKDPLDLFR